jgi:hypothetical protein
MSTIVTMTSTVGALTSGQSYRVRSRTAEQLVKASQATKTEVRRVPASQEGKG